MLINRIKNQRGVSLFELVLIVPVFIVLVTGAIDYGLGIRTVQDISSAARQGARLAAQRTGDNIYEAAPLACDGGGIDAISCTDALAIAAPASDGRASVSLFAKIGACEYLSHTVADDDLNNWDVSVVVTDDADIELLPGTQTPPEQTVTVTVERRVDADPTGFFCVICFEDLALETSTIAVRSGFLLEAQCT